MLVRIGLDFDNTIVCYDRVFRDIAIRAGFVGEDFIGRKRDLRDALRRGSAGEQRWQWLQAQAYGPFLVEAEPFEGVDRFVSDCRNTGVELFIVSHKSAFAAAAP